jgi:hypothetical protein
VAVLVSGMAAGDDGHRGPPRVLRYARGRSCAGNDGRVPSTGNDHRMGYTPHGIVSPKHQLVLP